MILEDIFPYPSFRDGQKDLAQSVYRASKDGNRLVAEAMSGFGKTAAVLTGTILASLEDDLNIVYACRTKRQVFRVLEEIQRFSAKAPVASTGLFSKYDYCLLKEKSFGVRPETFKWYCSFQTTNNLCTFFSNIPYKQNQVRQLAEEYKNSPSISDLLEKGAAMHVCPYEVARISLASSTIAVTTYHYLLDPKSRAALFTGNFESSSRIIGVVDEAHNVRDFVSGNSTTDLTFSDIRRCLDDTRTLHMKAESAVSEIYTKTLAFCSRHSQSWLLDKDAFVSAISEPHGKEWLSGVAFELTTLASVGWYSVATGRNIPSSLITVGTFLTALLTALRSDDLALVKSNEKLVLTNTNPGETFLEAVSGLRSLILLSATIDPPNLFLRSIGLEESTTVHRTISNSKFKIKTIVDLGVTTRFRLRTPDMYSKITEKTAAICRATNGGVGIFAPSYLVLDTIRDSLSKTLKTKRLLVEQPGLTNKAAEEMMKTFKTNSGCVLLAVQGGRFSEGEDFPGDNMDVSIVVGLSLPPPSPTTFADYMHIPMSRHDAYLVLSLLPALRKAFQCAGRHVRNPGKVGMVFFLDSRFSQRKIVELMPAWLTDDITSADLTAADLGALTHEFFSREKY